MMGHDICKNSNSGFSLVELIVVVLILGVLAGGASLAFSIVYNSDAEKAAKDITTMMARAREKAISLDEELGNHYIAFYIKKDNNRDYYAYIYKADKTKLNSNDWEVIDQQKLGNYKLDIYVAGKNATNKRKLINSSVDSETGISEILYTFKRSTGGIDIGKDYVDIIIENSSSNAFRDIVVPETGRCYFDGNIS